MWGFQNLTLRKLHNPAVLCKFFYMRGHLDVLLARHEDENVAGRGLEVDLQRLLDGGVHVVLHRVLAEEDLDREGPSGDGEGGDVAEEHRELARVHRCRGDDQLEVVSPGHNLPTSEKNAKSSNGGGQALVEFLFWGALWRGPPVSQISENRALDCCERSRRKFFAGGNVSVLERASPNVVECVATKIINNCLRYGGNARQHPHQPAAAEAGALPELAAQEQQHPGHVPDARPGERQALRQLRRRAETARVQVVHARRDEHLLRGGRVRIHHRAEAGGGLQVRGRDLGPRIRKEQEPGVCHHLHRHREQGQVQGAAVQAGRVLARRHLRQDQQQMRQDGDAPRRGRRQEPDRGGGGLQEEVAQHRTLRLLLSVRTCRHQRPDEEDHRPAAMEHRNVLPKNPKPDGQMMYIR